MNCTNFIVAAGSAALVVVGSQAGVEPGFLEDDVEVIYFVDGEGPDQEFGYVAETIGDITGDGAPEILTCAPYNDTGATNGGKVYVINGATGAIIHTHVGTTIGGFLGVRPWRGPDEIAESDGSNGAVQSRVASQQRSLQGHP